MVTSVHHTPEPALSNDPLNIIGIDLKVVDGCMSGRPLDGNFVERLKLKDSFLKEAPVSLPFIRGMQFSL